MGYASISTLGIMIDRLALSLQTPTGYPIPSPDNPLTEESGA